MKYLSDRIYQELLSQKLSDFGFFKNGMMFSFESDRVYVNGKYEISGYYGDYLETTLIKIIEEDGAILFDFGNQRCIKVYMPDDYNTDGQFHHQPDEIYLDGINIVYLPYLSSNKFKGWYI